MVIKIEASLIASGEINTFFLHDHFHYIRNEKMDEGTLLSSTSGFFEPYVCHKSKSGKIRLLKKAKKHNHNK